STVQSLKASDSISPYTNVTRSLVEKSRTACFSSISLTSIPQQSAWSWLARKFVSQPLPQPTSRTVFGFFFFRYCDNDFAERSRTFHSRCNACCRGRRGKVFTITSGNILPRSEERRVGHGV